MNTLKGSEGSLLMNNSYPETLLETINIDYSITKRKPPIRLGLQTGCLLNIADHRLFLSLYIHIIYLHKEREKSTIYSHTIATTTTKRSETSYTV